jgi:hypothetical protein
MRKINNFSELREQLLRSRKIRIWLASTNLSGKYAFPSEVHNGYFPNWIVVGDVAFESADDAVLFKLAFA